MVGTGLVTHTGRHEREDRCNIIHRWVQVYVLLYLLRLFKLGAIGESQCAMLTVSLVAGAARDHTHRIISDCLPTQNGLRAKGRSRPATDPDSSNLAPFSSSATMRRGTAAAVPLRVCAKVSGDTGSASDLR